MPTVKQRIEAQRVSKGGTYKLPVNGLDVGSLLAWSGRFSEWSSHKMMVDRCCHSLTGERHLLAAAMTCIEHLDSDMCGLCTASDP